MTTVDELGRAAAAALRGEVVVDAEAGLRRLHAPTLRPQHGGRRWALIGAAAVVVLAIAAFVLIDRSPAKHTPATVPVTTAGAPSTAVVPSTSAGATTSTEPATTATATTVTPTTAAPTTTATPTTAPAVVPPAADLAVFAAPPTIDLPLLLNELPLPGCSTSSCPSVVGTGDGTVVAFDDETQTLYVLPLGAATATTVSLREPGWTGGWLVAVGPGDIAYLFGQPTDGLGDELQDLVAVPLAGPAAGTAVARTPSVGDFSGDTDYVATARGVVAVGCCDPARIRPDPERSPTMRWVDPSGRPIAGADVYLAATFDPGYAVVTRSDSSVPFDATAVFPDGGGRGMPMLAADLDGGVLVSPWPLTAAEWKVLRARPDGSVEVLTGLTDNQYVLALDAYGPIVADGGRIARWQLAGYGMAQAIAPAPLTGGASFATSDDGAAAILTTLRTSDACDVAPTAELTGTEQRTDRVIARFVAREGCDDSSAGRAIAVELRPGTDGRWTATAAVAAPLCRRGVTDGLCV